MFARKHSCFHLAHPPRDCAPDTDTDIILFCIIRKYPQIAATHVSVHKHYIMLLISGCYSSTFFSLCALNPQGIK